ncbi:MAG: excinuclease ABC subunit UvrC [Victivallales bacterium]|jgi:excinuclease ABC subunit C|nr:excinuclease ABC subunit UvrC [Victivallales bacterium]
MRKSEFHPSEIPNKPGVYVYRDWSGKVIYVGKAANLRRRMSSYFQPSRIVRADAKLRSLINSIEEWSYEVVRSENEALILESRLIKDYAPYYNILLRDDKRYLLLKIDWNEKFPTLKLARLRKNDGSRYFGPFPNGGALRMTLEFLLANFGLRACRDSDPNEDTRKRCLKRIVKDCCAPCVGAVSPEEYRQRIERAIAVLDGDIAPLIASLKQQMSEAAQAENFEKAARLRDVMTNLDAVFGKKNRIFSRPKLPGSSLGGEAVNALGDALGLPTPPTNIIGFDISNILGKLAVASLVAFKDGKPDKENFRRFRIRTVHQSDDFAMMREVLHRHFGRLLAMNLPLPDLVMVDGGKGQLSAAIDALCELNCPPLPVIGLAKRNEEIFLPGRSEPIVLDRHDPALRMLQALRDEAHRFAISFHRELRHKLIEQSKLDEIPGIGDSRKRELLRAFGSLRNLKKASVAKIVQKVPGIGEHIANAVYNALHKGVSLKNGERKNE